MMLRDNHQDMTDGARSDAQVHPKQKITTHSKKLNIKIELCPVWKGHRWTDGMVI